MEELFNKPILDQMYEFRKEYFEQKIYNENKNVKKLEIELCDIGEELNNLIKELIPDVENNDKVMKILRRYEFKHNDILNLWNCLYFKLGMIESEKIRNEFFANKVEKKDQDTFLNYDNNNFSEWLEEQKQKYTFNTDDYKELNKMYREISEKYPNATEVFEDLKPIVLNKEEMKALIELRRIDIEMGYLEKDLCFKLGMKEVINF